VKRLVLLGGGHAHVEVVRAFGADPPARAATVLVNRTRLAPYSGMMPGLIAGHYRHAQCHIDLEPLCAGAGIERAEREAVAIDARARRVLCADGHEIAYDLLSIDTGSTPPLDAVPGAREHAIAVRPMETFLDDGLPRIERSIARGDPARIAVAGGGAASFEVATALAHRFRSATGSDPRAALTLITDTPVILPTFPAKVREIALERLADFGIAVRTSARVARVERHRIVFANGASLDADHTVWLTGASPSPIFAAAGLATDARGFVEVDAQLRSCSHPEVFAAGDAAEMTASPRPKAGVFAVRQGPVLAANLRCALEGRPLSPFRPQTDFLVLLSTGRRYAIATRGRHAVSGAWAWRWKDWIDRRFMRRYGTRA